MWADLKAGSKESSVLVLCGTNLSGCIPEPIVLYGFRIQGRIPISREYTATL